MKWIKTTEQSLPHMKQTVLTVGNFDGVHLGHQKLIETLTAAAQEMRVLSVVCTFKPHPRALLFPEKPTHRLFDYRDQAEKLEALGVDYLIEEKFTKDFSLMSAEEYLELYIQRYFNPVKMVVGYDFNFGKDRGGDIQFLKNFCQSRNIELVIVPALEKSGQIVSSSAIRNMLEHGDLARAEEFLGRRYYLRGPVRVGFKRGRQIGVPTANISPDIDFVPRKGVYFSVVEWNGQKFAAISNIGFNPTFESKDSYLKVETHIFNFNQEIYGEQIKVELLKFHRDEMKFSGIETLKQQIQKDMHEAHQFFQGMIL